MLADILTGQFNPRSLFDPPTRLTQQVKCTKSQSTNNPLFQDVGVQFISKKYIMEKKFQYITFKVNNANEKDSKVSRQIKLALYGIIS